MVYLDYFWNVRAAIFFSNLLNTASVVLNFRDCGRKKSSDIFALIYVLFQLKTIFSKSLTLTVNVLLNAVLSNYEANTKRIANKVSDTSI